LRACAKILGDGRKRTRMDMERKYYPNKKKETDTFWKRMWLFPFYFGKLVSGTNIIFWGIMSFSL
jgi:hypothetical protein